MRLPSRKATLSLAIVVAAIAAVTVIWWRGSQHQAQQTARAAQGEAAIGGAFELVNTKGETVTEQDFRGRYLLVNFGYTYCPDVCPGTLANITRALNRLAETDPAKAEQVVPIFITVDPNRDDVETMGHYVSNFHDRMVGLTGSPKKIHDVAKKYRVYYEKSDQTMADGEYLVNHSSYVYVMGPKGRYLEHFTHKTAPDAMANVLSRLMGS